MPPKVRRPAAAVAAKALPKAAARVRARVPRGILRRPGASLDFQSGGEVEASCVKLEEWTPGLELLIPEGYYYGQEVSLCGEVRTIRIGERTTEVMLLPLGSPDEDLVKWTTANPGVELQVHVCPTDCNHIPDGEGILHAQRVQKLGDVKPPWALNLKDAVDELTGLRARQREAEERKHREEMEALSTKKDKEKDSKRKEKDKKKKKASKGEKIRKKKSEPAGAKRKTRDGDGQSVSVSSSSTSKRKGRSLKVLGQKTLGALFNQTGLDPDPAVRRRIRKKLQKGIKRRKKKGLSSASSETISKSTSTSQKHRKVLKQHEKTRRKKGWRFLLFPGLAGSQEGPGSFGWDIPRPSEDNPGGSPIKIS